MSCIDRSEKRTLRACENSTIRAFLERLVELSCEDSLLDTIKVVVGLDVFLDCLTTVARVHLSAKDSEPLAPYAPDRRSCGGDGEVTVTDLEPDLSLSCVFMC